MIICKIDHLKVVLRMSLISLGYIIAAYFIFKTIGQTVILGIILLVIFCITLPKVFSSTILITDEAISCLTKDYKTTIRWNEIDKIAYKGNKYIPMTESIRLYSLGKQIEIDFNRKDYLEIWKLILQKTMNDSCAIDIKITQRLSSAGLIR